MVNKSSPEYIRVREQIAKKLYRLHRGIVDVKFAEVSFGKEAEQYQDFYRLNLTI